MIDIINNLLDFINIDMTNLILIEEPGFWSKLYDDTIGKVTEGVALAVASPIIVIVLLVIIIFILPMMVGILFAIYGKYKLFKGLYSMVKGGKKKKKDDKAKKSGSRTINQKMMG